ncbi:Uncharacterized protein dnm_046700 [Desulfonema magnum]|uniref:Uncharacterized protein n=1 Tax=Desulfonema magnum TaxID=45655 RepID=A0A975BNU5_9BACT|nr:Uncharacterized protein dnm_046700 [Desulfonema magnum]
MISSGYENLRLSSYRKKPNFFAIHRKKLNFLFNYLIVPSVKFHSFQIEVSLKL